MPIRIQSDRGTICLVEAIFTRQLGELLVFCVNRLHRRNGECGLLAVIAAGCLHPATGPTRNRLAREAPLHSGDCFLIARALEARHVVGMRVSQVGTRSALTIEDVSRSAKFILSWKWMMSNTIRYLPTPNEIRSACLEIQRSWTEQERMSRRSGHSVYLHVGTGLVSNRRRRRRAGSRPRKPILQ